MKRLAERASNIERADEALRNMVLDLGNFDATILHFQPDFRVKTIMRNATKEPVDADQ